MIRTIVLNGIEPAFFSIRNPLGVDLDVDVRFLAQDRSVVNPDLLMPQLALMPRSSTGVYAYDIATVSGHGSIQVPGSALNDPAGYNMEVFARRPASVPTNPPVPVALIAKGVLRTEGSAYASWGPLAPINIPVVTGPPGPPGPAGVGIQGEPGEDGLRGSRWTTGVGDPVVVLDLVPGDMYLDETTGNVWRWDGSVWAASAP